MHHCIRINCSVAIANIFNFKIAHSAHDLALMGTVCFIVAITRTVWYDTL